MTTCGQSRMNSTARATEINVSLVKMGNGHFLRDFSEVRKLTQPIGFHSHNVDSQLPREEALGAPVVTVFGIQTAASFVKHIK